MVDLKDIRLPRTNAWYYEFGYLTIDLNLFGRYLSVVFNEYLDRVYSYQTFNPKIQTTKNFPIWLQEEDSRRMAIIGPNDNSRKYYENVRTVNIPSSKPWYIYPYTMYSKDYETLFSKRPLVLDKNDFLLYFGDYNLNDVILYLGKVDDGIFVPNDFSNAETNEVKYENSHYSFIEDFVNAIFYYKIMNRKPNLDEADMEEILRFLKITKEEKIENLINILRNMQQKSMEVLLRENSVENTLKLIK